MIASPSVNSTLVFIPTFNESENVNSLCNQILKLEIELDILFIDDNSTDGTGIILDKLSHSHPNLTVIHRAKKMGIGSAHLDGIRWAYDRGYFDFNHYGQRLLT